MLVLGLELELYKNNRITHAEKEDANLTDHRPCALSISTPGNSGVGS